MFRGSQAAITSTFKVFGMTDKRKRLKDTTFSISYNQHETLSRAKTICVSLRPQRKFIAQNVNDSLLYNDFEMWEAKQNSLVNDFF